LKLAGRQRKGTPEPPGGGGKLIRGDFGKDPFFDNPAKMTKLGEIEL